MAKTIRVVRPEHRLSARRNSESDAPLELIWSQRTANLATSKNGDPKVVYLNDTALTALRSLPIPINDGAPLFPIADPATISRSFRRACCRANIPNFKLHDMRHHFASAQVIADPDSGTARTPRPSRSEDDRALFAHFRRLPARGRRCRQYRCRERPTSSREEEQVATKKMAPIWHRPECAKLPSRKTL